MEKRKAKFYILVDPDDCFPPHGLNMEYEYHRNKVKWLRKEFEKNGFDTNHSALVGYPSDGKIQLLSGTHRHRAAKQAGIKLPVTLWLRSDVERVWGTEDWKRLIEDVPVKDLECMELEDGFKIPPYDVINISEMYIG